MSLRRLRIPVFTTAICLSLCSRAFSAAVAVLPGTQPLEMHGDVSAQMVSGIDTFLLRETENSITNRKQFWHYDFSSLQNYEKSITPNREHLRKIVGAVDPRQPIKSLEYISDTQTAAKVAETEAFTVFAVRWPVLPGVFAEGLWLKPKAETRAGVVAIPDADQTPEMLTGLAPGLEPDSQIARTLAAQGCEVLVPTLVSRDDTFSGNPKINRFTNQPHREYIYRQAFQMGRHVIGYEIQKVLAAIDFFSSYSGKPMKLGVAGYGEGGLLALYAAALDTRIDATLVSGYFNSRQQLWQEPIYRNIFGLLTEFSDAEIATLIAPRSLIIQPSPMPIVTGPPKPHDGRSGAAPGQIITPDPQAVSNEVSRIYSLLKDGGTSFPHVEFISQTVPAWQSLLRQLGVQASEPQPTNQLLRDLRQQFDPAARQQRQVTQLTDFTQQLFRESSRERDKFFWKRIDTSSLETVKQSSKPFKDILWNEAIGRIPGKLLPANPRSRKILEKDKWTAYEVVLDVYPDVFTWGQLLLPHDLSPGERRPVVVCQHGLEGVPEDVVNDDPQREPYHYYQAFAARLAEQGFIVFAPHNPYRGGDKFRVLQRKANPLKQTLFSIILAQHEQLLHWLAQQPFVDSSRIGFYGLSYGGKTAMRVPALLDGYALSICSGDFNDWNQKVVSVDYPASYQFTGEYEIPEFDLGHTFNYAEMAALIAPRPFMVERGHNDGVAPDTWVASEYSIVRRFYDQLNIPNRTRIEFFNGPHTIHGVGTFEFLHDQLTWPENGKPGK